MLGAIDNLLLPAVQAGLAAGQDAVAGPALAPPDGATGRIAVCAVRLLCQRGADEAPARDPAYLGWQGVLTARPGHPLDFPLPDEAPGELAEVLSPPGQLLAHGDAYLLDGRLLRFFRPPPGPVTARTRGPRCAGYRERGSGQVELELRAWGRDGATVDALLARALGAVLARFEALNVIDLGGAPPSFGLRLARPRIALAGIERQRDPAAPEWLVGVAQCLIHGELEVALSLGTPEPDGLIGDVDITLHLPGNPA